MEMMRIKNLLSSISKNKNVCEFIRFVIVGIIATLIHYIIYFMFQTINVQYNISYTIGYFSSFIFNFFASNFFTFKSKPNLSKGIKFFIAHGFNYTLQIFLLNLYIFIGINQNIAPLFVFVISIPINFIFVRFALKK